MFQFLSVRRQYNKRRLRREAAITSCKIARERRRKGISSPFSRRFAAWCRRFGAQVCLRGREKKRKTSGTRCFTFFQIKLSAFAACCYRFAAQFCSREIRQIPLGQGSSSQLFSSSLPSTPFIQGIFLVANIKVHSLTSV